jgi:hypothetical protein
MTRFHTFFECVLATKQVGIYGWAGIATGVLVAILLLIYPRSPLNIQLSRGGNYQFGGITAAVCVLIGLLAGSIIGAMVNGSCIF